MYVCEFEVRKNNLGRSNDERGKKEMCVSSKVRSVRIRAKLTKITWDDDLMLSFENTGTINSAYFFVLLVWYWYVQNKCRFLQFD